MEKFALLDFLKAFESLSGKRNDAPDGAETAPNAPPQPQQQQSAPAPSPEIYENNVMANVIARHEEISNRLRNKK